VRVQRYICLECGESFTLRRRKRERYTRGFEEEVVRRYIEERESYRVLAKRIYEQTGKKVSTGWLNEIVLSVASRCKSGLEMSRDVKPRWKGFLCVDEKMFSVRGEQQWFYVAVDTSGDIVHCKAVEELSTTEATKFLREIVEECQYNCRGVVTDLDQSLRRGVEIVFPGKPHQFCLKHAFLSIEKRIGYKPLDIRHRWNKQIVRREFQKLRDKKGVWVERARGEFFESYEEYKKTSDRHQALMLLRDELHRILFARTEEEARRRLRRLVRSKRHLLFEEEKQSAISFLRDHWYNLMEYHQVNGLPRTNNFAESVNKQLERRFKTMESFQRKETAAWYINLLVSYLRQKPYTDCRGSRKHLNGKSRLEAAGVKLISKDWLKNSLKSTEKSNR